MLLKSRPKEVKIDSDRLEELEQSEDKLFKLENEHLKLLIDIEVLNQRIQRMEDLLGRIGVVPAGSIFLQYPGIAIP